MLHGLAIQVLHYHGLYRNRAELVGKPATEYLSEIDFARQVRWLKEAGYALLSLSDCRARVEQGGLPEKTTCLTFDDGKRSDLFLAAPILKGEGARATFFVVPGWFGNPNILVRSEVQELAKYGMEIGSHSMSHSFLTELGPKELEREVLGSKHYLEDLLGQRVESFCYPHGDADRTVREAVEKAGYRIGCLARRGPNTGPVDWLALKRWGIPENTSPEALVKILARTSPSFGESAADLLRRAVGMRRYVRWRDRWVRRVPE